MRITRRHLAVAAAFVAASLPSIVQAESADEAAVRKAVDDLNKAMIAADKAKLEMLVADQLSYGHSGGRVETKQQFVGVVAGKKTIYKSITISDPTVAVVGNNAIARHGYAVEVETDGKPNSVKITVMQVWVKDGGAWKLLARQAFRT